MKKLFLIPLLLLFAIALPAGSVLASTAANTQIINNASLSFDDGTGIRTITASVTVTVDLVAALPNLIVPPDDSTVYVGPDTPLTFDYTITAGSNGPDTYTVASSVVPGFTNTNNPDTSIPTPVILGASVTSGDTGSLTTLQVPSDGSGPDNVVNEIEAGDIIVVDLGSGPETVTVLSVTDPGSGMATITLEATTPLTVSAPAGTPIYEQQVITLTVDSGTIVTPGTDITVTAQVDVTNSAGTVSDQVVATYTNGSATLTKYVRNVTNANGNSGGTGPQSFTIDGFTGNYYTGGVTGEPGDTLEYVLVADNTGTAVLTDAVISDLIPEIFVNFSSGAYGGGADAVFYIDTSGTSDSFPADGTDLATFTAGADPNLVVYVGVGAVAGTSGSIPGGDSVTVAYQVTIIP